MGTREPRGNKPGDKDRLVGPVTAVHTRGDRRYADLAVLQRFAQELGIVPGIQEVVRRVLVQPSPGESLYAQFEIEDLAGMFEIKLFEFEVGRVVLINL